MQDGTTTTIALRMFDSHGPWEAELEFKISEDQLDAGLAKVEGVRNWSPRVMSKLESTIRTANDEDLFRVNPIRWALEKSVDEHEAIDLFLHSVKAGLFYMDWNVLCPCCGLITQSFRNLHGLQSQSSCAVCTRTDRATLDDFVQITFTLSPSIRSLRFHHPESLSLDEYYFKYRFEPDARFGHDGTQTLADFREAFEKHFSTFSPGERITVEAEIEPGLLDCSDLFHMKGFAFIVNGEPATEVQTASIQYTDHGFELSLPEIQPGEIYVGHRLFTGAFYALRPGKVVLEFEQSARFEAALLVIAASFQAIEGYPDCQFSPRLTAKRLFACQTFHDLFRSEVFRESDGFSVKDVTILFTDLKGSTQLYNQIGDLNAFALVREHYGVLNQAILNQHGAVVKTIGDAIMATFTQPKEAVSAGLEMLTELERLNQTSQRGALILKIGIHRGAAISVTLNERIDYFGQTVNIASRVQGSAGGNEIYLTEAVYTSAGVVDTLDQHHCEVEPIEVELRGIEELVNVYRVTGIDQVVG